MIKTTSARAERKRRVKVLSVGTPVLGNAVYHANLCASLKVSEECEVISRSVADYWNFTAKVLFATLASPRLPLKSYRARSEWTMSEVARLGITRDLMKQRVDVVHCHTQSHSLRCERLARQIPFVVSMDATACLLNRLHAYTEQRESLATLARWEKRLFEQTFAVCGVSQWVMTSLRDDYRIAKQAIFLCSPCVDTGYFKPNPLRRRRSTGKKMRLLFVGQDLRRKGGDLLLRAMSEGLKETCELHIISTARQPSGSSLGVIWHDGVKPCSAELLNAFQDADIFILPTREDCFPMVLIEAMACGLPIISTTVMGVPELVRHRVNGMCIEPNNEAQMLEAVHALGADPTVRNRMAQRSREIACKEYSFGTSRETWETLFSKAAKHRFAENDAEVGSGSAAQLTVHLSRKTSRL